MSVVFFFHDCECLIDNLQWPWPSKVKGRSFMEASGRGSRMLIWHIGLCISPTEFDYSPQKCFIASSCYYIAFEIQAAVVGLLALLAPRQGRVYSGSYRHENNMNLKLIRNWWDLIRKVRCLGELRVKKFPDIQEEICCRAV